MSQIVGAMPDSFDGVIGELQASGLIVTVRLSQADHALYVTLTKPDSQTTDMSTQIDVSKSLPNALRGLLKPSGTLNPSIQTTSGFTMKFGLDLANKGAPFLPDASAIDLHGHFAASLDNIELMLTSLGAKFSTVKSDSFLRVGDANFRVGLTGGAGRISLDPANLPLDRIMASLDGPLNAALAFDVGNNKLGTLSLAIAHISAPGSAEFTVTGFPSLDPTKLAQELLIRAIDQIEQFLDGLGERVRAKRPEQVRLDPPDRRQAERPQSG